jgi:uncharacterized protein (TIGR00299 family) protein
MKLIYLDCYSGISGDMFLGAMVDMGVSVGMLSSALARLNLDIKINAKKVNKRGIMGTKVDVIVPDTKETRNLADILQIINKSQMLDDVRATATNIFKRLASAESAVHGVPIEKVHFHEIGALDTIADVVGAAFCYKSSGAEGLYASAVNVGSGSIKTAHGVLPVPAPATLELLKGVPIYSSGVNAELVTPTGAAILVELSSGYGPMPSMRMEKTGYGAGTLDLEPANMLRAVLGEKQQRVLTVRRGH